MGEKASQATLREVSVATKPVILAQLLAASSVKIAAASAATTGKTQLFQQFTRLLTLLTKPVPAQSMFSKSPDNVGNDPQKVKKRTDSGHSVTRSLLWR